MSNNRRNRERRPARRTAFREPKPRILVVCEGRVTEPQYLRGFVNWCRNPRVDVVIDDKHGVPRTLVEIARKKKKEAEKAAKSEKDENLKYDKVWIVTDVDQHPNLENTLEMARANKIYVALSNPCFELWLILHFRESPGMISRHAVQKLVKKMIPDYAKSIEFSQCEQGYFDAVGRAEKLDEKASECEDPRMNPTTNVYQLTESIRPKPPDSPKQLR